MRTSPGGRKLEKWDREKWNKTNEGTPAHYKCENCNKGFWLITNPSPNTIGGTRQMQVHQERCFD